MSKVEQGLTELRRIQGECRPGPLTPLCLLLVTFSYLIIMLSVSPGALTMLLWFAIFPIIGSALLDISYSGVFLRSLIIVPFALMIGMFNPIFDTAPAFRIGSVTISHGWVTYISIIVRTVLSLQAVLILTKATGFNGLCRTLRQVGVPLFLTMLLMMVYRYLTVLLEESVNMRRAREARGYEKKHMGLKMWSTFIGQLFLRTVARADRIHRAMLARGFNGEIRGFSLDRERKWRNRDTITLILGIALFILFRFLDVSALFGLK